jgi:uncharacterized membrane protein YbhN (UPF0104 family)
MKTPHSSVNFKRLKQAVTLMFFMLVAVLLFTVIRNVDWEEVGLALRGYSSTVLATAIAISALSYLVFSSYDVLGRIYTGHRLPLRQLYPLAFTVYAFNLNFGAWVGSLALRYRLYSRAGLSIPTITRILSISLISNWLGYMLLAGIVFSLRLMDLPASWQIGVPALQLIGFGLLAASLAYLLACRFSRRRSWQWRDHEIILPSLQFALLQGALGAVNWSLMAALIYVLLPEQALYPSVLGVLLVSSIAGVVTHIPAGLGVLEAIFLALLQHQIAPGVLLAALIVYRAVYFLLPLTFALIFYMLLERHAHARQPAKEDTG